MGKIKGYIGCPGYQRNELQSGDSMEFKNHMEAKFVIAEIRPCHAKVEGKDGNIYLPEDAIGDFKSDLKNAGHSMEGDVLKIVISNPQAVTETYSNQFGDSEIFGGSGNSLVGGKAAELAWLTNTRNADDLDKMAQDFAKDNPLLGGVATTVTGGYKNVITWAKQKGAELTSQGHGTLGNAVSMAANLANSPWSKTNWPQMWKNCSYQQTYELNTRLYCYHNNRPVDYNNNILAPLAALQLLVTPKSDDGVLYTWPYIFSFKIDGVLEMKMAYCSSLQVVKGGDEGDFAADGRPNIIDIRMSIQNCYSVMVNCKSPKSFGTPTVKRDNEGLKNGKKGSVGKAGSIGNSSGGGGGNPSTSDSSSTQSTPSKSDEEKVNEILNSPATGGGSAASRGRSAQQEAAFLGLSSAETAVA